MIKLAYYALTKVNLGPCAYQPAFRQDYCSMSGRCALHSWLLIFHQYTNRPLTKRSWKTKSALERLYTSEKESWFTLRNSYVVLHVTHWLAEVELRTYGHYHLSMMRVCKHIHKRADYSIGLLASDSFCVSALVLNVGCHNVTVRACLKAHHRLRQLIHPGSGWPFSHS